MKLREQELIKAKEEKAVLVKHNLGLKDQIRKNEKDLNNDKSVIHALKDQIDYFKEKAQKVDMAQARVDKLEALIQNYHK